MEQIYPNPERQIALFNFERSSEIDNQLLEIYWFKKELEEFLPKIATYSTPEEVSAITLSQLNAIENKVLQLLRDLSVKTL